MAGISTALTSSISSLKVNQEALALIANNIANANTENYTRREVVQSNQVVNGVPSGVQIEEVRRAVDMFVVEEARRQISHVGRDEGMMEYYDRLELFLGEPGSDNSLPTYIDDFFAALTDLSNSPELASVRASTLSSANTLANAISGLANDIQNMRFDIDQEIKNTLENLNTLINEVDTINTAIDETARSGGDLTSLFDERDAVMEEISSIMEVTANIASDGRVSIAIPRSEIVAPSTKFKFSYTAAVSVDTFINDGTIQPIEMTLLDSEDNLTTSVINVKSGSADSTQEDFITSGKLRGLLNLRDVELPKILAQLDELAQTFADNFNAVHNQGGGYPPASTLTGTRLMSNTEDYNFSGNVRIAVLDSTGNPVQDAYDPTQGLPPLNINLDELNGGGGAGTANIDTIIREINEYYGAQDSNMAALGDMSYIRAAAVSSSIASTHATGVMDFSVNPGIGDTIVIDGTTFTFVANGTASNGTNIELGTTLFNTINEMVSWLNDYPAGTVGDATYTRQGSRLIITHDTAGTTANAFTLDADVTNGGGTVNINGLGAGAAPGATTLGTGTATAGVDANGNFTFDLEAFNFSDTDATIEITDLDINGAGASGETLGPVTISAGERARTGAGATTGGNVITFAIPAGLEEGDTFTLAADVSVTDQNGTFTETITFTVTIPDPNEDIINVRYPATAISGAADGTLTAVSNGTAFVTARNVDADGNTVTPPEQGYLSLTASRSGTGLIFDELDSLEGGKADGSTTSTGRSLSHFFGLNDFFEYGGATDNAAVNFSIRSDYANDSARLATASMTLAAQPADPTDNPVYAYEIGIGSNQVSNLLAGLKTARNSFDSAGTLPDVSMTFSGYASEVLSFTAQLVNATQSSLDQQTLLYDTFRSRLEASGGINVDEELANTVVFQNNYTASARIINVISELFEQLIETF